MSKYYKNLKIEEVNSGFGWRYSGDLSTQTISNILDDLDYKFGTITNNIIEAKKTIKQKDEIIDKLVECVEFYAETYRTGINIKARATLKEINRIKDKK